LAGYHQARSKPARTRQSSACFLAPSRYEIMAGGKKLLGSAQRRLQGVILQQGSLPLEMENGFLDYWQLSATRRASLKNQWGQQTAALWDLAGPLSREIIKQALIAGFEQALPIKLVPGELTAGEKQMAKGLLAKYQSPQWNEQRAGK
jgi:lipoate-protein ligase A